MFGCESKLGTLLTTEKNNPDNKLLHMVNQDDHRAPGFDPQPHDPHGAVAGVGTYQLQNHTITDHIYRLS